MPSTLLLADDSLTIQRVIELTFADEDVHVVAVSDGDQAIERVESSPPDIVLADIGMPGRNGYEVARYIKHSPKLSHIPVVLLTGAFEPVDEARAAEVGCDGVLAKPFEPQLVITRVKELLAERRRMLQATDAPAGDESALPLAEQQPSAVQPGPLDDYFDRLDAAFANMAKQPSTAPGLDVPMSYAPSRSAVEPSRMPASRAASALISQPFTPAAVPASEAQDSDVSSASAPVPAAAAAPAMSAPAVPAVAPVVSEPTEPAAAPASRVPERAAAQPLPAIADAFAALLAAEQTDGQPSSRPVWPDWRMPRSPAPEVTDELVEEVARTVLDRLSDRVVREKVSEIVSSVAERLVREEIERLKSSIK